MIVKTTFWIVHGQMPTGQMLARQMLAGQMFTSEVREWLNAQQEYNFYNMQFYIM